MTATRARGRRGQGTLEFILVLPLLIIMLVAVADYAHLARETASVQTASSEWTRQPASVAPETPSDLSGKMHGTSLTTLTVTFSRE